MDNVLVIDDDHSIQRLLARLLARDDLEVHAATAGEVGLKLADEVDPEVVLLDLRLPDVYGLDVLDALKVRHPETAVIIMTAFAQIGTAVEAMKKGAVDYIEKPFAHIDKLRLCVRRALDEVKARRELQRLTGIQAGRSSAAQLVGESEAMQRLRQIIAKIAPSEARTVLISGESGTGKELVARALHYEGPHRALPFIEANCAAIPEPLFESEVFGHEKGAFTDARTGKKGLLELADRGTIFLDEIGDMALGSQAKLLRCLQERVVRRVGGTRDIKVDVRLVAATNRSLPALVQEGRFREDLFHRLNVIPVTIPPLRERREDIVPLARHFLAEAARQSGKVIAGFAPAAERLLLGYAWPGNVRELKNVIERVVILGGDELIEPRHLPLAIAAASAVPSPFDSAAGPRTLAEVERAYVQEILRSVSGNKSAAAKILGITRQTLRKKLESEVAAAR